MSMNLFAIFRPLLEVLIWLLPLFLVLGPVLRAPRFKGWYGEWRVRLWAALWLDRQRYRRLHDVTLRAADGVTTQIDHVFLSPFGIFVVETKNMRGWIFGEQQQAQWTQQFHRQRFQFQNPLRQNYRHLKTLEALLGVSPEHLYSVIAFVGNSHFKTPMPVNVTSGMGFVSYIRSFREPVFSVAQVEAMLQTLQVARLAPTRAIRRAHVRQLRERHAALEAHRCPACGSPQVIRRVGSGPGAGQQFWGCSSFPKCRTSQSLD